jgi:hypothetical protein
MNKFFISIFIFALLGCVSDSKVYLETKPKHLLDEDKFTDIYKELLLIESTARITTESGLKGDSMILVNSDNYYAMNAEKFLEINESIKKELGVLINKDRE